MKRIEDLSSEHKLEKMDVADAVHEVREGDVGSDGRPSETNVVADSAGENGAVETEDDVRDDLEDGEIVDSGSEEEGRDGRGYMGRGPPSESGDSVSPAKHEEMDVADPAGQPSGESTVPAGAGENGGVELEDGEVVDPVGDENNGDVLEDGEIIDPDTDRRGEDSTTEEGNKGDCGYMGRGPLSASGDSVYPVSSADSANSSFASGLTSSLGAAAATAGGCSVSPRPSNQLFADIDSDLLLEAVEISLGRKKKSEAVFFKDSDEEADRFLVETGEAISPLAAKARSSGYMGNIRSKVKVGARNVPLPRPQATHAGPWLPAAGPVAVPAKVAGPGHSDFTSKTLVLGNDGQVRIPGSSTRKRPGTTRPPGDREAGDGSGPSHLYSKVAAKSSGSQGSLVLSLPADERPGADLDLSPNSRSFPSLLQAKSVKELGKPEVMDTSGSAATTPTSPPVTNVAAPTTSSAGSSVATGSAPNPASSGGAGATPPAPEGSKGPRYAPVVTVAPAFGAVDIRESTTPAQREARAAELKAAAEEKARLKTAGKTAAKSAASKGGKAAASTPSLSKEAKDAAKSNKRAAKNAKKQAQKEKKRPAPVAPTPSQVIDSSESSQSRADQRAAEMAALLGEDGDGLDLNISKEDEDLLRDSDPEEMDVDGKGGNQEAQYSSSESSLRRTPTKTKFKGAGTPTKAGAGGSAAGSGGEHSSKSIWVRLADPVAENREPAYFDLLDDYTKHVREACARDDFTVPRLRDSRWLDREGRMKLVLGSAEEAEYVRKWIERDPAVAKKYTVEEKKARVPLLINAERIRLPFRNQVKVKEFFALEARYLPVAGFTGEDIRPGELVQHERGWHLRLSLSPGLASYAKKAAQDMGSTHQYVLPLTVGAAPLFTERGQGQKRQRDSSLATGSPSSPPNPKPPKRASTAERLMELASSSGSDRPGSSVRDRLGHRPDRAEAARHKLLPGISLAQHQGWEDRGIATSKKPVGGFKKPQPKSGGKVQAPAGRPDPQYSSSTTDGEAATSGKAKKMRKEEKECENKEVKNLVVAAAEGLPPRKVRTWVKFLKDSHIVCKEDSGLFTAGRLLRLGSLAVEMQPEILDGRWDVTEDGEFVLSARGKKLAEKETSGTEGRKLIVPGSRCGVTTTEDESADESKVGPVGVEPRWIPSANRTEAPPGPSRAWDDFLAGMEVFVEAEGQRLPGPNYRFLGEYEASRDDLLRHRLKVGHEGSLVVDPDGRGHHHDGEVIEDEKRAVERRLAEYDLDHENHRIRHLLALRREGFGSPLDDYELDLLDKRGEGD